MGFTLNTDDLAVLKAGAEEVLELPKKMERGIDACVTVSQETGSAHLLASANSMKEASLEVAKATQEFNDAVMNYHASKAKTLDALG